MDKHDEYRGVSGLILVQLRPQPLEANQHGDFALFQRPACAVLRWTTFSAGRRFTLGFHWYGHQVHDGGTLSLCPGDRQYPWNGACPGPCVTDPAKTATNVRKTLARRRETICRWLLTASVGLHLCHAALCPRRVLACQLNQAAPFEFLWQSWKVRSLVDPRMPAQFAHILVIRITS